MHQIFPSSFFNFEFLRVLGAAPFLGADVAECLETASQIKDGDPDSWHHGWWRAGQDALSQAREAERRNDKTTACWAYIRASNYFRASEFMLHCTPSDPRMLNAANASVEAFDQGSLLLDATILKVEIPYDSGKHLPGRLYLPTQHQRISQKLPLLVQLGGFDSTQEELYFLSAAGALPRGYAVLSFDGPGQGMALRTGGLFFRHDWEQVTGQVIDFITDTLAAQYDLDLDRLAVAGSSLGGHLALRAATDARVKACISVDGPFDLFGVTKSRMPGWFINGWLTGWLSDGFVNSVIGFLARSKFQLAWEFGHSMWVYGVNNPTEVLKFMSKFTLQGSQGGILSRIKCPTFVTGAADSFYFLPEENACKIMDGLTSLGSKEKELWIASGPGRGGLQAKIACLSLYHDKIFSWLDATFEVKRPVCSNEEEAA